MSAPARTVTAVLAIEPLALGEPGGSVRAQVRWSDGTEGEALRWYDDELAITAEQLLGRSADELRTLHFALDRAYLAGEGT